MAARLLSRRVMYLPNFRAAVEHFRAFSWYNNENSSHYRYVARNESDTSTVWPDETLGPFSPQDKRFFLPGSVGTLEQMALVVPPVQPKETISPESLFQQLPVERQGLILQQAQSEVEFLEEMNPSSKPTADDMLECVAHDCPELIRKEFADLFPQRDIMNGSLSVITISQRTEEDMTKWAESVETEREKLLETFIDGATEICQALQLAGYWGDFIDPASGKPYLGPHTNGTLYETDERYRKFGFDIEDLGCCKVIRHQLWGTHAYVGCIFTNAPTSDPILKTMTKT